MGQQAAVCPILDLDRAPLGVLRILYEDPTAVAEENVRDDPALATNDVAGLR